MAASTSPPLAALDFTDKAVIVTGSSSGIGAATAIAFAARGAQVTIIGRNEKRLLDVAKSCEAYGRKPLSLLLDLTIDKNCEEVVRKTAETFGKIDILINCAGKAGMNSLFDNNMEVFDELVALNLRVPYKMTQICVPFLKQTKGSIVNIFAAPLRTRPGFLPFSMLRDALERFTKFGALELASVGIRMNAVCPGLTRTNFLLNLNIPEEHFDAAYAAISDALPLKTVLEPNEITKMVLFIASDTCPNLIGSNVTLDACASI